MKKNNKKIELLARYRDSDKTEKFVFLTKKGIIELTWVKNKNGIAVFCLPTHHYCNLGCKFCHLSEDSSYSKQKMIKISATDLSLAIDYTLKKYVKEKKILFSFMGVGEPFLNLKLIIDLYKKIEKKKNYKFSYALSTMMLIESEFVNLLKVVNSKNIPLKIHFSLHSPIDKERNKIIPHGIDNVNISLKRLKEYQKVIDKNKVINDNLAIFHKNIDAIEIHYTIIDKINDDKKSLDRLIELGRKYKIPLKILKFNPTKDLKRSKLEKDWLKVLKKNYPASVYFYKPPGPNIGSSCGQFTKHYYLGSNTDKEKAAFKKWHLKYNIKK